MLCIYNAFRVDRTNIAEITSHHLILPSPSHLCLIIYLGREINATTAAAAASNPTNRSTDAILDGDANRSDVMTTDANEAPMSPTERNRGPDYDNGLEQDKSITPFDIVRYLWSTFATVGSLFIIFYGISIQAYVLPSPPGGTYIIFIMFLILLFYLEGLMIAVVGTQYWDRSTFIEYYPRAAMLHELMTRDKDNVKRFIIGRQFCTVLTNFMLGQITTMAHFPSDGYNPIGFYIIVKSGLVGVMVVLAFAQLCPELLAAEYPLRFMNLPGGQHNEHKTNEIHHHPLTLITHVFSVITIVALFGSFDLLLTLTLLLVLAPCPFSLQRTRSDACR